MNLSNDWKLLVIPHGEQSPMEPHLGSEIRADYHAKTLYCWETFMVIMGSDSIAKSCEEYISLHHP